MHRIGRIALFLSACSAAVWAQSTPPMGMPARMVVTTGHFYGHPAPMLTKDDLTVTQSYQPLPVTDLVPLRGDRADLKLFLLVDNCSNCEIGSQFDELRKFIGSQPATTSIGVAYIQDGQLKIGEPPTRTRERTIQALSVPAGSKPTSPFTALRDLIKGWEQDSSRHAVLMISNGIDPARTEGRADPAAEAAIEAAQRAGVIVYVIYHPSANWVTVNPSQIDSGQVQLAHVALETGGEAYFLTFGPLRSFAPFLSDIADHLANQYLLEFLARPSETPGALVDVTVKSKNPDVEVTASGKVWVAGRTGTD